mmetsp:Transcript_2669/g.3065  ORF Transcript_2669/g.3065 Transcript_2669/m.3065 type:complete len:359 (+) Transcript_2669:543-1619(+)
MTKPIFIFAANVLFWIIYHSVMINVNFTKSDISNNKEGKEKQKEEFTFASDNTTTSNNDNSNDDEEKGDISGKKIGKDSIDDDDDDNNNKIMYWDLPSNISSIILNVGSHRDPIVPDPNNKCGLSIAVEPIVHAQIESHPQLHVLPAAVSTTTGVSTMHVYSQAGVSSSLAKSIRFASDDNDKSKSNMRLVPTITMNQLLSSIPPHIPINFMMTDMQGYDYAAVKFGMKEIVKRQIPVIVTEVSIAGQYLYEGVDNDLCFHWIPMMTKHGYYLYKVTRHSLTNIWFRNANAVQSKLCQHQSAAKVKYGFNEGNAIWRLVNSTIAKSIPYIYPTVSNEKERYEAMNMTLKNITLPVECF